MTSTAVLARAISLAMSASTCSVSSTSTPTCRAPPADRATVRIRYDSPSTSVSMTSVRPVADPAAIARVVPVTGRRTAEVPSGVTVPSGATTCATTDRDGPRRGPRPCGAGVVSTSVCPFCRAVAADCREVSISW